MPIATRDGAGGERTPARSAILGAARSLFASRGLRGTTVRAISRRSGLSNTLLYYYFPNKEVLLAALLEPPPLKPVPRPAGWTVEDGAIALEYLVDTFYGWVNEDDFLRMVIIESYAGNELVLAMANAQMEMYINAITPLLAAGCGDAEAHQRATSLGYSLTGLLWQSVMHDGKQFRERLSSASARQRIENTIQLLLPLPRQTREVA